MALTILTLSQLQIVLSMKKREIPHQSSVLISKIQQILGISNRNVKYRRKLDNLIRRVSVYKTKSGGGRETSKYSDGSFLSSSIIIPAKSQNNKRKEWTRSSIPSEKKMILSKDPKVSILVPKQNLMFYPKKLEFKQN